MNHKIQTPTGFQGSLVPSGSRMVGWAALAQSLSLQAPVRRPSCVSEKHVGGNRRNEENWTVFDKRYWSGDDFRSHLTLPCITKL